MLHFGVVNKHPPPPSFYDTNFNIEIIIIGPWGTIEILTSWIMHIIHVSLPLYYLVFRGVGVGRGLPPSLYCYSPVTIIGTVSPYLTFAEHYSLMTTLILL